MVLFVFFYSFLFANTIASITVEKNTKYILILPIRGTEYPTLRKTSVRKVKFDHNAYFSNNLLFTKIVRNKIFFNVEIKKPKEDAD